MFNSTTQIVAAHVIPYYLKRGDRHLLYMEVGQEITDIARKIISCEIEYENEKDEIFPQWVLLTCCPRSYNNIQWDEITFEINRIADELDDKKKYDEKINNLFILIKLSFVLHPIASITGFILGSCLGVASVN